MMTKDNHVANRKSNSHTILRHFPQFEDNFMARFVQKKPNRFQECFLAYVPHTDQASIDSKAWDVATALTYADNYKQKEIA